MDAAPSARAHPHPRAGGRGDGPREAGDGTGSDIGRREARNATPTWGTRDVIARRTCATGVQAARRRPGEAAARRRCGYDATPETAARGPDLTPCISHDAPKVFRMGQYVATAPERLVIRMGYDICGSRPKI